MDRGLLATLFTFPMRYATSLRHEDMSQEEMDFAHITTEVYKEPGNRRSRLREYTLLDDMTDRASVSVSMNDVRWAVYRADNDIDHILVFRGTLDWEDMAHDVQLLLGGRGEHEYTMDAAIWAHRVMLSLSTQREDRSGDGDSLKFRVAGHSLGGTVAMGVSLLLHDVPAVGDRLGNDGGFLQRSLCEKFREHVARPWEDSAVTYEICGGHIFNPGFFPREMTSVHGDTSEDVASVDLSFVGRLLLNVVQNFERDVINRLASSDDDSPDKKITTHHVLGDLISCSFALGMEKSYRVKKPQSFVMPTGETVKWGVHSMANFLDDMSNWT